MKTARAVDTDVLIVGAGPAGLVMALCLAKLSVGSIVLERNSGINEHPKAHELNARSIEILAELGIALQELETEASPPEDGCRIAFAMRIAEEFGSIDLLKDVEDPGKYARHLESPLPYLNISQTEIERILFARVAAEPLINLKLEHQWQSHIDAGIQITSVVLDRQSGKEFELDSKFLIAADGAGSRIRKALKIEMIGPDKLQDLVGVCFETSLRDLIHKPAKLYWILEPDCFGTLIAHHIDRRWVFHVPIYEPWESAEDYTEEVLLDRLKRALGTDRNDIQIKSSSVWRMAMQVAERWREGSVFLVGDAAHRFPPTGGLGMNTGIADAHNLAWKMAAFLNGEASPKLLESYEIERRQISVRNGEESLANYERIFDVFTALGAPKNGGEMMARLKDGLLLRLLPRRWGQALIHLLQLVASRKIRSTLEDEEAAKKVGKTIKEQIPHFDRIGLDIGYVYKDGALISDGSAPIQPEVTHYTPSTLPGARFPHMWLEGARKRYSTHALLSYNRWTLFCAGNGVSWAEDARTLGLNLITLDELDASANECQELNNLCEIGESGAVLIRPDGHVAWRCNRAPQNESDRLRAVIERCGLLPKDTTIPSCAA